MLFLTFCGLAILNNTAPIHDTLSVTVLLIHTGYEPNRIAGDQEDMHFIEDDQFTKLEELRVRLLSFHQSMEAST